MYLQNLLTNIKLSERLMVDRFHLDKGDGAIGSHWLFEGDTANVSDDVFRDGMECVWENVRNEVIANLLQAWPDTYQFFGITGDRSNNNTGLGLLTAAVVFREYMRGFRMQPSYIEEGKFPCKGSAVFERKYDYFIKSIYDQCLISVYDLLSCNLPDKTSMYKVIKQVYSDELVSTNNKDYDIEAFMKAELVSLNQTILGKKAHLGVLNTKTILENYGLATLFVIDPPDFSAKSKKAKSEKAGSKKAKSEKAGSKKAERQIIAQVQSSYGLFMYNFLKQDKRRLLSVSNRYLRLPKNNRAEKATLEYLVDMYRDMHDGIGVDKLDNAEKALYYYRLEKMMNLGIIDTMISCVNKEKDPEIKDFLVKNLDVVATELHKLPNVFSRDFYCQFAFSSLHNKFKNFDYLDLDQIPRHLKNAEHARFYHCDDWLSDLHTFCELFGRFIFPFCQWRFLSYLSKGIWNVEKEEDQYKRLRHLVEKLRKYINDDATNPHFLEPDEWYNRTESIDTDRFQNSGYISPNDEIMFYRECYKRVWNELEKPKFLSDRIGENDFSIHYLMQYNVFPYFHSDDVQMDVDFFESLARTYSLDSKAKEIIRKESMLSVIKNNR